MATWKLIDLLRVSKMRSRLPSFLLTSFIIYVLGHFLVSAANAGGSLVDEDPRLPSFSKNSNTFFGSTDENGSQTNESQSSFKSHIYCGGSEFYVQITFKKPFKGLLYAYRNIRPEDGMPTSLHYPVQILDTCTLKGYGASQIFLELSFFSECVEHLASFSPSAPDHNLSTESPSSTATSSSSTTSTVSPLSMQDSLADSDSAQKYNLDGFNFRRALDTSHLPTVNMTSDQTYQLSLYIQNDPTLEQKTDSKILIQCSSQVTKNIVVEQNFASSDYSRRVDSAPGVGKDRTIVPTVNLTVSTASVLNQSVSTPTARIDILRGRVPFVKLIDSRIVEIGDDLTVIIRAKAKPDGFEWKVSQCYAHEGNNTLRRELTNEHGCPVDGNLMPAFKVLHQPTAEYSTVFYTSFAAFKFSSSNHLRIECQVLLCRLPCPEVVSSCENSNPA